ncbi:hypothetical protein AB3Y40_12865 [Yoonia sp. R2331]|uniref:hypothetical protein n=1 Tax=Yoonia sp. R2331 TaxID=3237238 RepID=UPI0034E3F19C
MPASKTRGPKYPSIGLEEAIRSLHPVFEAESRNKMSREVLAAHLGYSGLNGAATSKIGALRHFGLIEGRGDDLHIADHAIALLMKNPSDPEFQEAVKNAFLSPNLYRELYEAYETTPSMQNVEFALVRNGVQKKGAQSAATDFVESGQFAGIWDRAEPQEFVYNIELSEESVSKDFTASELSAMKEGSATQERLVEPKHSVDKDFEEKSGGLLSKNTEYKLYIKGPLGPNELKRLIRKVEIDIEILLDEE